jgi:hypothetical protein
MMPVEAETLRIWAAAVSEIYKFPEGSKASPNGSRMLELVAAPPSPAGIWVIVPG